MKKEENIGKKFKLKNKINSNKKELQILKNEYGIFYIADKNGDIQYYQGTKILASKDIKILKEYLKAV